MTRVSVLVLSLSGAFGCGGSDTENRQIQLVSTKGTTKSHFPNTNCMSCHQQNDLSSPGGNTPGFFTLAGTIRLTDGTPQPNLTVILYDRLYDVDAKTAGSELMRLDADALGLFYTTKAVPILEGGGPQHEEEVFPAVLDPDTGIIKHMYKGISTGSCNICHHDNSMDMSPRDDIPGDPWTQLP